jgi:hypothetical protein
MIGSLIALVIYVVVIGLILWLLNYLVDAVPMEPPFKRVAKIAILVIGVLVVILLLLQFIGAIDSGFPRLGRL